MRRVVVALAFLVALLPVSLRSSSDGDWTVYLRGAGPLRIGMSIGDVRRALQDPAAALHVSDPDDPRGENGCTYLQSGSLPKEVGVLLEGKRVVRIDVHGRFRTASGAGVGDSEDRVKALYAGRIVLQPHRYDPDGHYLVYMPVDNADRAYGLVFETDGKVVTMYRAGLRRAVAWVEGCS
jgi:hypothetical protein